jgi:DNA repair protein RadC
MSRRTFSYVETHYCRVLLVKDAPIVSTDPLGGSERLTVMVRAHSQDLPGEAVYSIVLDARRRPLAVVQVSVGTLTQSLAHPREIFFPVLYAHGAAVAIAHNHPSGDPTPSPDDHTLTRRIRNAADIMGIPLVDHVIVGGAGRFYSYAQSGWPL